ncbi:GNAT family N-acetyltransferase [Alkalicoccus chagannorensis]|uniref:GNAT family N-acetyltransferase n=1 Tax=Alkalicoccus chagannorensis TaxID=427072 RepID=UPI0003FF7609|nr:GNAT family N-acetyltransferase [Alkalicoccus chagannorensis]
MIIRKMKPGEADKILDLSAFAFQHQMTEEERRQRKTEMNPAETWVAEADKDILAKLTVLPLHHFLYGASIPSGGVSGVASWPEYRRQGIISKLLKHALEEMYQEGQYLSFLFPFSIPFYRRFGYELFADQETLTLQREQLPPRETHEGVCHRVTPDNPTLEKVYRTWASRYNGTIDRTPEWWKKSVFRRKTGMAAAYFRGGEVRGYLLYHMKENHMDIQELVWLDPDARKGLFAFITNHDSMAKTVSLRLPAHSHVPYLLHDPKVIRNTQSYFMCRIVNAPALLAKLPVQLPAGRSLTLQVEDSFCAWNAGTYQMKSMEEGTDLAFTPSGETSPSDTGTDTQLELSIQPLSAIVMGAQSAVQLWDEGVIHGDREAARMLDESLPTQSTFIYDFF